MTFGSLFAGIGGFDLGLERAGMECRWQVEIDSYASGVLAKHWPNVTRWSDVRTFPVGNPSDWHVDLICAGVPCQPVSHAGKQKGASDERWMWGEALRIVADLCPRFFVAENPIGLLNHDGGRTFHGILRAFASVGYICEWHVIAASAVGAPHRRERVWLVAYADSVPCTEGQSRRAGERVPGSSSGPQRRQDKGQARAIAGHCGANVAHSNGGLRKRQRLPQHSEQQGPSGDIAYGCSSWGRRARPDQCREQWKTEPAVGRVADGVSHRVDRLRCLGNAVVPQVAEVIGRAIIELHAAQCR
jgi:DNA (cytosine-5)-methyltransferase 1